jgi:hypothetical protein
VISANAVLGRSDRHSSSARTRAEAQEANPLAPSPQEYVFALVATLLAAVACWLDTPLQEFFNLVVPVILAITLLLGIVNLLRLDRTTVWAPVLWNRVSIAVYFCIGNLVPYLVGDVSRRYIEAFFLFQSQDVANVNLVTSIFLLTYLATCSIFSRISFSLFSNPSIISKSNVPMESIGLIFIISGSIIYFFTNLSFLFGINVPVTINSLTEVGKGVYVGILLLSMNYYGKSKLKLNAVFSFSIIMSILGMFELNKSSVLFPLIVYSIGIIYKSPKAKTFLISTIFLLLSYSIASGPVTFARNLAYNNVSGFQGDRFGVRFDQLLSYYDNNNIFEADGISQTWIRISYLNGAAFAVYQYDIGNPGDSWKNVAVAWIPRAIYPNKPIITDVAKDFSYAAMGTDTSLSTPGLIAEAYWNKGWLGIVLVAMLTAALSTAWAAYSIFALRAQAWHLFPIVLLGIRMGLRFDGMLASDIVGPITYAIVGHFALQFLNGAVLAGRQKDRPQTIPVAMRQRGQ